MKIALFGGAFDPPHIGHVQIVAHLLQKGFDQVWVIPCWRHPFGKKTASFWDRWRFCRAAFRPLGRRVKLKDVERRLRQDHSWTYLTVRYLKKKYPADDFTLAVGQDNYEQRREWFEIEKLEKIVSFLSIPRGVGSFIADISSSAVREKMKNGEDVTAFLPPAVCRLIG